MDKFKQVQEILDNHEKLNLDDMTDTSYTGYRLQDIAKDRKKVIREMAYKRGLIKKVLK